ncbi:MAG: protein phosphatase 2C domain-containing protein [Oscillospiraceae bacterium]|nr:protein phosphatase 2C domain-containing protein [Oscillospiraceae bacterium]
MKYCEYTNTGIIRSVNQDSLLSLSMNGSGLFVVADGMGGHIDGEIASKAVKKACQKWWNTSFMENSDMDFLLAVEEIKAAIEIVNKNLIKKMEGTGKICGTTVAVVFIHNGAYAAMNIGDSRIYLSNKRGVRKISFDHTLNSFEEIKNTALSEKDKLTQAIGVKEDLSWYTATDTLKNDEKFFICTDGVYKYTEEEDLFSAIKNYSEEEEIKKEIEKQVILGGAPDNFSFIAIDMRKEKASVSRKPLIIVSAIAVALFVIFTVIFAVAVSGDKGENIQTVMSEKLSLGQKFLLDLEYDKAVAEFTAVIDIEPKNVDAYMGLASAYIGMGEKDKAIETLEKGLMETDDETIRAKLMELKTPEETTAEVTTTPEETTPETTTTPEETTTVPETTMVVTTQKAATIKKFEYEDEDIISEFDSNGRIIKRSIYKKDGTLLEYEIYGYDSYGNMSEGYFYKADGTLLRYFREKYDENGRIVDATIKVLEGTASPMGIVQ